MTSTPSGISNIVASLQWYQAQATQAFTAITNDVLSGKINAATVLPQAREFVLQNWLVLLSAALFLFVHGSFFGIALLFGLHRYLGSGHANEVCRILVPLFIVEWATTHTVALLLAASVMHLCYSTQPGNGREPAAPGAVDEKLPQTGIAADGFRRGWFKLQELSRALVVKVPILAPASTPEKKSL